MNDSDLPPEIRKYLMELRWSLTTLPNSDCESIVEELRAHMYEAIAQGQSASALVAGFGSPALYAREYVEAYTLSAGIARAATIPLMSVLLSRLTRSFTNAFFGLSIFLLGCGGVALALLAVAKVFTPDRIGLWLGTGVFVVGSISQEPAGGAREVLGYGFIPAALLAAALCLLLARALVLGWARRSVQNSEIRK